MCIYVYQDACVRILMVVLFKIAPMCKQSKCPSRVKQTQELWYILRMEYCMSLTRNELYLHPTAWMNLQG